MSKFKAIKEDSSQRGKAEGWRCSFWEDDEGLLFSVQQFIDWHWMQGPNGYELTIERPKEGVLRKSAFLSESEALRDFDSSSASRKLVSASTYLRPNSHTQIQLISPRRNIKHATDLPLPSSRDYPSSKDAFNNSNRPLTYRSGEGKQRPLAESMEKLAHEDFNSHLVQLKMEEMAFKFKSRIGTLLKEISISVADLTRFSSLAKIDEILNFLSEKVKQKLVSTEISENNVSKVRSKQRQLLAEHEGEIEALKKRLQQKETLEKTQKIKIKQNHAQIRDLYDKLNFKEKEFSAKITELYQTKTLIKENEKLIESLQSKNAQLDKERTQLRENLQNCNKDVSNSHRAADEENQRLKIQMDDLKEELEMAAEKQIRLLEANKNMSFQLARWRERFEEEREKTNDKDSSHQPDTPSSPNHQGSSIKSHTDQDSKLLVKNLDLQQEVKRLQKEVTSLSIYKQKYESVALLSSKQKPSNDQNDLLKLENIKHHSADLYKIEIEAHFNKKMEEMTKEWRDKLIEIVEDSSSEQQKLQQTIDQLQEEKKTLEKKVFILANEKYMADCKIIEKESEIYQIIRTQKNSKAIQDMSLASQQLLISTPEIQPLHESVKFGDRSRPQSFLSHEQNMLRPSIETYSIELDSPSGQ